MNRCKRLLLALAMLVAFDALAVVPAVQDGAATLPGEPAFEPVGVRQGMASSAMYDTFVDRFGFVWFAGDNGVHRYDGEHVRTIDRDPDQRSTLASRTNVDLAQTRDAMWVLSFGGVVQRVDLESGAVEAFALARGEDQVSRGTHILADHNDTLWISTDLGLFRFDTTLRRGVALDLGEGAPTRVTALTLSDDGRELYVGRVDGSVFAVEVDTPAHARALATLGMTVTLDIAATPEALWLGTAQGLFRLDRATGRVNQAGVPDELKRGRIDALLRSRDGALWLGGAHHVGLVRFDPANGALAVYRHHADDPYSLTSDRVGSLALDQRDNLWIGLLSGGANRLRVAQQGATRYRANEGQSNSFCAMREQPDGHLLVALCGGSIGVLDPRSGALEDRSAEADAALGFAQPTLNAHAIVPDGQDGFWLPTNNTGLLLWRPGAHLAQRIPLVAADGSTLPDPYMNDAVLDGEGRLWVGCSFGLAVLNPGAKTLQLLDPKASPGKLFTGGVFTITPEQGQLWLGTTQGLVHYDPASGAVQRYAHDADDKSSLSDNFVIDTYVDASSTLWVGTQAGLNRVVRDGNRLRFRRYAAADGVPDQTINAVSGDARGALWIGTPHGIAMHDPVRDRFNALAAADGVPDSSINWRAAMAAADGSVYFGSASGLMRIFPERLRARPPQPAMLGSFEIGARRRVNLRGPDVEPLAVDYSEARVRFLVAAFGDGRPMSYRLSPLQLQWQAMPADLSIGYDPLPPGDYRFEVRQMGANGAWQQPGIAVPLTVAPPPWRTREAYALYAAAAAGVLLLLLHFYRQRRVKERQHLDQLHHLATYDTLTGLPNRARFEEDLAAAVGTNGEGGRLALFFIDLDRFKNINDSLGHRFGDLVLMKAAQRLQQALPPQARLARLGGDEFTVILPSLQHEVEAAGLAQALLGAFATPLSVEGSSIVVTLSLGISLCPEHSSDPALLVQYADSAMYYAKLSGRNAARAFQPEMIMQVSRRLALETALRRALANSELHLHYQAQIDLATEAVCGVEVLLRWHSAEHGTVSPAEFIPILEDTGMIHEVGLWVMEQVCAQVHAWQRAGQRTPCVAVNVSMHQLIRGDLSERLAQLLATLAIPRHCLEIELTESAVMENAQRTSAALHELRSLGLGVSIDDFGTGYSSFGALSQLPVDKLKIDKVFIDGVGLSESADTLCAAIIAMAHNLKLRVVAEGVETALQHARLKAMGCDYAQGYWYGHPVPLREFEDMLLHSEHKRAT